MLHILCMISVTLPLGGMRCLDDRELSDAILSAKNQMLSMD